MSTNLLGNLSAVIAYVKRLGAIFLVLLCGLSSLVNAETTSFSTPFTRIKNLAVFEDKTSSETLQSVIQHENDRFIPQAGHLTQGYSRSTFWVRFNVQVESPGEYLLNIHPPFLDDVRLYVPHEPVTMDSASFEERRYGDKLPFSTREIPYRSFIAHLNIPHSQELTFYARLQTSSSSMLFLSLMTPTEFEQDKSLEYLVLGLYFGLIVTLLTINLLYWFWMQDSLHGYFSLFVIAQLLLHFASNGLLAQFVLPEFPVVTDAWVSLSIFLTFSASAPLYRRLLRVEPHAGWPYRVFQAQLYLPLLLLPCLFVGYFTEAVRLLMMTVFILSPVSIWLAYRRWREKETGSFFILLGFLITNLGVISVGLTLLGLWPSEIWQLHSRQISVMGNILAMHIAVAARFRYLKQSYREAVLLAARAETKMEQERRSQDEHRQFVAMLTHELRTPLSVIDGAVQSLEYLHQTVDDETQLRHHRIRRSVKRINGLIKQFIAKDRIEDSRLSLHLTCIDPAKLASEVIDTTLDNAKQRIDLVIPTELPDVYADNALIQVALSNLLDNALKYSPPNTKIELSVLPLSIQGQAGVAWVVADQGPGIATDSPEDYFGKYVRGNEHVHIAGTGLGLYLVRRIAEKHGGTAETCIKEGWSGVVRLWLPTKEPAA